MRDSLDQGALWVRRKILNWIALEGLGTSGGSGGQGGCGHRSWYQ